MKHSLQRLQAILCLIALLSLLSCASNVTSDQQARIVLGDVQQQLDVAFDVAKAYYDQHPDKKAEWQGKVIPIFDTANKSLLNLETLYKRGAITMQDAVAQAQPILTNVVQTLATLGVKI